MRRAVIPLALLLGTFAWSFVFISLPYYVQRLSPLPAAETLRWTGWILGITPLMTVLMAPWWGRPRRDLNGKARAQGRGPLPRARAVCYTGDG
jgi:hypothetical protein